MSKTYTHLTLDDRITIQILLEAKLGRPRVSSGYRGDCAQQRANRLKAKPRVAHKMVCDNAIWERVIGVLHTGLSPEQASGILRTMNDPIRISHEAIYTALYAMPRGELRAAIPSPAAARSQDT